MTIETAIPWIPSLPSSWTVQRAKTLLYRSKSLNSDRSEKHVLSLTLRGVVDNDPENPEGLVPEDYATYQLFETDDLVFKLIDLENVRTSRVGLVPKRGIMSSAYLRLRPRPGVCVRFLYWSFFDLYNRQIFNHLGSGVRSTLGAEDVLNLPLPVPDVASQRAIADYLDTETARIDALIAKKQRMIDLLNDRIMRKAELLSGDIQSGRRMPLSSLFRITKGLEAQRLTAEYCSANPGPFPVYSGQTSGSFGSIDSFDFFVPNGAIVVSTVGARVMSQTVVRGKFSLSQNCLLLVPHRPEEVSVEYFVPQLRLLFERLRSEIPDHMQPSLRVEDLRGKKVIRPSREIQMSIALQIRRLEERVAAITEVLKRQLDLLQEERQALINAAVTGELEIPGVAA